MAEEGLTVIFIKMKRYSSYKGEISPEVPNLLERDFHAKKPNQKWLSDITEFGIPAGKVYLSPIVDCFDGYLPSWTIGTSPDADLVNTMLEDAISKLPPGVIPIVHTDYTEKNTMPRNIRTA
jgi:putative transposase